jgi:hypothetical protein
MAWVRVAGTSAGRRRRSRWSSAFRTPSSSLLTATTLTWHPSRCWKGARRRSPSPLSHAATPQHRLRPDAVAQVEDVLTGVVDVDVSGPHLPDEFELGPLGREVVEQAAAAAEQHRDHVELQLERNSSSLTLSRGSPSNRRRPCPGSTGTRCTSISSSWPCGARKPGFGYAACAYSLIGPPRIGRRSTRPASTRPACARGGLGGC